MHISLFTTGRKSLLGIKEENSDLQIFPFDSNILFQDPALFYNRFLKILQKKYPKVLQTSIETGYLIEKIIFSLPGDVDSSTGIILHSDLLNTIASPKLWDGFNFKMCFEDLLPLDKIQVINSTESAAYGIYDLTELEFPAIVVIVEDGISVAVVEENVSIYRKDWQQEPIKYLLDKTASEVLSPDGIDTIIRAGTIGVIEAYTNNLSEVISHFVDSARIDGMEVKTIIILTDKKDLIDVQFLMKNLDPLIVNIPEENKKNIIYLHGILHLLNHFTPEKVIKIEYWSAEEQIYVFKQYEDFFIHWKSKKAVANQDNEYRIFYSNGLIKRVKMKEFQNENQLIDYQWR